MKYHHDFFFQKLRCLRTGKSIFFILFNHFLYKLLGLVHKLRHALVKLKRLMTSTFKMSICVRLKLDHFIILAMKGKIY